LSLFGFSVFAIAVWGDVPGRGVRSRREGISFCERNSAMQESGTRQPGDIDTSFGTHGAFELKIDGYKDVELIDRDRYRAMSRAHDGSILLAVQFNEDGPGHLSEYGVVRLTSDGALDPSFGEGGVVFGAEPRDASAVQAWPASDGSTVVLIAKNRVRHGAYRLVRLDAGGALDATFGSNGSVVLDELLPAADGRFVVGAFVVDGLADDFFVVGVTKSAGQDGSEKFEGGIVFRFDVSGRLDDNFAGNGYAHVALPLGVGGEITDAVVQDDEKVVLGVNISGGNARLVRLLPSGEPDMAFGDAGHVVINGTHPVDSTEVRRLTWAKERALWAVGTVVDRSIRIGLLVRLDDQGKIPADFNEGKPVEIKYGRNDVGAEGGLAFPMSLAAVVGGGINVIGRSDYDRTNIKRAIVGRHLASGALDGTFGEANEAGDPTGFIAIHLDRDGGNFHFFGADIAGDRLTFEIVGGDGSGGSNPDRVTVERYRVD
jgi:uncharacterized delta-60 repeat protein